MIAPKLLAPLLALGVVAPAPAPAPASSLYQSRQLWATVDVCNPKDQPDTIGIRGSMPDDGHKGDKLFMRFRVQYQSGAATAKKWVDIAAGADSGFLPVHAAAGLASQSGRNFQLVPTPGAFTLRGVVSFQWRRGKRVVHSASRPTSAGHESLAGADPKGFSAATCTIG